MKRPHQDMAPHEAMFYRDKLRRMRRQYGQGDNFGSIQAQQVMLGALGGLALLAVGGALIQ